MSTRKRIKFGAIVAIIVGVMTALAVSSVPGNTVQALFFNNQGGSQISLNDLFASRESTLDTATSSFDIPLTDETVVNGKTTFNMRTPSQVNADDMWRSIVSVNGGSDPTTPPYQLVLLMKATQNDASETVFVAGVTFFDPLMDESEKEVIWIKDASGNEPTGFFPGTEVGVEIEWGMDTVNNAINADTTLINTDDNTVLQSVSTRYTSTNFIGKNVFLRFGAVNSCVAPYETIAGLSFSEGSLLVEEVETAMADVYTCDTDLDATPIPVINVPDEDLPGTGVVVEENPNIIPVDLVGISPDAGSADLKLESSVLEKGVVATVDPNGNGDFMRIEDALAVAPDGIVALAGGVYHVDTLVVPDGVILSGGWDNVGFRTRDYVNNPTYIFQKSDAPVLISLAGKESGIEGIVLTSENTCISAFGRAHTITNNALRKCEIGVHAMGVSYIHAVNNTFYDFTVGMLFDDYSAAKIVGNVFKTGETALINNSMSL